MKFHQGTKNNVKETYDTIAETIGSDFSAVSELSPSISKFLKMIPQASKVLDVGPGKGAESKLAIHLGHSVIGMDISAKMLEIYKKNVPSAQAIIGNMTDIPLKSNSIDVVLSSCSLLHLDKERGKKAIKEFSRVLKKNGLMFLITSIGGDKEEINQRVDIQKMGISSWYFYHWDEEQLKMEITKKGFDLESSHQESIVENRPFIIFIKARKL